MCPYPNYNNLLVENLFFSLFLPSAGMFLCDFEYGSWSQKSLGDNGENCICISSTSVSSDLKAQIRYYYYFLLSYEDQTFSFSTRVHHLTLPEAADLAENRPLWRMMSTYAILELDARNDNDEHLY